MQAISDEILVIILAGKKSIQFFTNGKIIGSQTVRVNSRNYLYTYDLIHLFTSTSKQANRSHLIIIGLNRRLA